MRVFLYKKDQDPTIFEGDDVSKALKDGWVDCPTKVDEEKIEKDKPQRGRPAKDKE